MKCAACQGTGEVQAKATPRVIQPQAQPVGLPIVAGEKLTKGVRVVVDESTGLAFGYPNTSVIPGQRLIYGNAGASVAKGKPVTVQHWCFEDMVLTTTGGAMHTASNTQDSEPFEDFKNAKESR